jgi:hypothetical protein
LHLHIAVHADYARSRRQPVFAIVDWRVGIFVFGAARMVGGDTLVLDAIMPVSAVRYVAAGAATVGAELRQAIRIDLALLAIFAGIAF